MNKLTRGAIAAGAGLVLLLGGAGTFALWSDSVTLNGSTITAGELKFGTVGSPTWVNATNGGNTPIANISTFKMVPGNTLKMTQTVQITATGDDLKADLTYNPASITIDPALASHVTVTLGATSSNSNVVSTGNNTFRVTPASGVSTVTVTVTVAFDPATPNLDGQTKTVVLNNLALTLTQVAP